MRRGLWSVVLAGGSGRRLAGLTGDVPKQFWRPDSKASLLEQTLLRIAPLSTSERTVVVVDRTHERHLKATWLRSVGEVILQPSDRGTAVGMVLGLMPAWTTAPEDIVIVTPSDHAFSRPWRFRDGVVQAAAAVESGSADVVIFGAAPTAPTAEFGWLTLGEPAGSGPVWPLRPVLSFVEKPPSDEAVRLYRAGATWNTLVAVARVRALVALLGRPQPDVVERMAEARRRPSAERQDVLTGLYRNLPASDFSRDVLTRASGLASYCWPLSAGWTDLGTPERVQQWQSHYASVWARRKPDQLRA